MKTPTPSDRYQEIAVVPDATGGHLERVDQDQEQAIDLGDAAQEVSGLLAALPVATAEDPRPFLAGTFALYKDSRGAITGVFDISPDSLIGVPGVHRRTLPRAMLRGFVAAMSGTGAIGRLMSLGARRRGRE